MNAEQAIARSISHQEIVTITGITEEDRQHLAIRSEDSVTVDSGRPGLIEWWGTDDDGNEWRVHTRY